jgi:hypothetical protein
MNKGLTSVKTTYGLLLGILLAMLVGFGITAFYGNSGYYYGGSDHARNVLLIAFACGLVFSVAGLLLPRRLDVFRLGLLAGGLFTLLFALIYPAATGIGKGWIFGAVAVALVVLVPVGYLTLTSKDRDDSGLE